MSMKITLAGDQDKQRLDFIARNIYAFPAEEYRIFTSEAYGANELIMEINTFRHIDPIIKTFISEDMLSARISCYPGINSTKKMSSEDIEIMLIENFRLDPLIIKEEAIKSAVDKLDAGIIIENILIATGIPKENGRNGKIEYLFEVPNAKPKLLANGSVDYKEFNNFIVVKQDQIVVKHTPPTMGKDGKDVCGNPLKAVDGVDVTIEVGEGIYANEEKTEYRASHSGHVLLAGKMISVLPVLEIKGDVDMKVGNIRFDGTVHVSENVCGGFVIDADSIIVEGIVENASHLM